MRLALLVTTTAVLAACGGSPPSDQAPGGDDAGGVVEVILTCDTDDPDAPCVFEPDEVSVQAGGTVRWINDDATFHTVTSSDRLDVRQANGLFDAVIDETGETFEYTFDQPGEYPYYCQPHAEFMAGTVSVTDG